MAQRGFVVCRLSDGLFEFIELQSNLGKELQQKWRLDTQWFEWDEQATWDLTWTFQHLQELSNMYIKRNEVIIRILTFFQYLHT